MATITVTNTLDVTDKYETLVQQSLGGNSVYIRAKETIDDLFINDTSLSAGQKADIVSNIIGSAVNAITSVSMSTALEWAKVEKEIELEKLKLQWQLDTLEQESLLAESQVAAQEQSNRLAQVESRRMYGAGTFDVNDNLTVLDNSGKVYSDIQLVEQNTLTAVEETQLAAQKTQESFAAVHKIVADTYVNYGHYTWSGLTGSGLTGVTAGHGAFVTLSDTQQSIAEEQAKGYTYNAWANSLTGSSSMLGTAIAAEYAEFSTPGQPGYDLLQTVLTTATNLKDATLPA